MARIVTLVLFICTILAALLLASCSNPMAAPDPFDQALGNMMSMRAASFQARALQAERSAR